MLRLSLLTQYFFVATFIAIFPFISTSEVALDQVRDALFFAQNSKLESLLLGVTSRLKSGDEQLDGGNFVDVYIELAQANPLPSEQETRQLAAEQAFQQGWQHYDRGEFPAAINAWKEALAQYQTIGNRAGEVNTYISLILAYNSLGQYDQALVAQQRVLETAQLGSRAEEGQAYQSLGLVYMMLDQYDQALTHHQQALGIFQEIGNRAGEGRVTGILGTVYFSLGEYYQALTSHQQALDIAQELGDRAMEGTATGNLGTVYFSLGQYDQALTYHQWALDIAKELGDLSGESSAYGGLGTVYFSLGQYDQALTYYNRVLAIVQESGILAAEGEAYSNLGKVYLFQDQYDQAQTYYQRALDIAKKLGNRSGEGEAYNGLGTTKLIQGQYDQARTYYQRALDIAQDLGLQAPKGQVYSALGIVYDRIGQYKQAIQSWQAAIAIYETLRPEELGDANLVSLLDTQLNIYGLLQDALVTQGQPNLALETAEVGRAQALKLQLLRILPEEQATRWTSQLSIAAMQQIAAEQMVTLVSYTVLWNGDVLIWVIQPDGQIHQTSSDLAALPKDVFDRYAAFDAARGPNRPETPLQALVQGIQAESMEGAEATGEEDLGLDELYKVLIAPIVDWLPEDETEPIIFIPHRELFQVPFAALQDPETDEYLVENHTIATAPSILSLALTQERQAQISDSSSGALIVGNPTLSVELANEYGLDQLQGAEAEAEAIAKILSETVTNKENLFKRFIRAIGRLLRYLNTPAKSAN